MVVRKLMHAEERRKALSSENLTSNHLASFTCLRESLLNFALPDRCRMIGGLELVKAK